MLRRSFLAVLLITPSAVAQSPAPAPPAELPKVVLIGDSIRQSYAPLVARLLAGRAVVVDPPKNGGDSGNVLRNLDEWVIRERPAVVHFNAGLHDLRFNPQTKKHQVEPDKYRANLQAIVTKLQQESKARLVFANTTPVIAERYNKPGAATHRYEKDVQAYNAVALEVMQAAGVPVHDLHWVAETTGVERALGGDGVHFTGEGRQRLAEAVADCVLRQLAIAAAPPSTAVPLSAAEIKQFRQAQAERDALVPDRFKRLPVPQFDVPASAAQWYKRRDEVQRLVRATLGDLPPRPAPQRARIVTRELRPGYVLERVTIDNGLDSEVTLLLLVPEKRQKPAPAILWLHSSTPDKNQIITPYSNGGKEPLGEVLVRAGYVVVAPDAYWYGDRGAMLPTSRAETYRRGDGVSFRTAQDVLHKYHLWFGRTLWGMMVRDDQIALDYLCARSEVDAKRVGATGMSMGSTRAWWLAALDERVAAAVGVACMTRYQNLIAHGELRAHGVYYFVNGLLKHFDTEGVFALVAPRPLLMLTGDLDRGSPVDGIRVLEEKVGRVYEVLGTRERFRNVIYKNTGHIYTEPMRAELLAWFERWLKPAR